MTYQSTAADTPYSGDLYNLNPDAVDIMSILKASFKAAGFVVTQSGDGLSTYSTSADILTTPLSAVFETLCVFFIVWVRVMEYYCPAFV